MPETAVDVMDDVAHPEGFNGSQSQFGGVSIENQASGEARNIAEGENAAESEC
jgi:hypothetical protein